MMRLMSVVLLTMMLLMFSLAVQDLPLLGDANSPAATHVSSYYIENAYLDTGASNLVTAVLISYRGFDTLGETIVIFIAGLATLSIVSYYYQEMQIVEKEEQGFGGEVLDTTFRYMIPLVLMYGLYILVHGEYSPGGAFQAGALFAFAVISSQLIRNKSTFFKIKKVVFVAGSGVIIFLLVGLGSLFYGGFFLELDKLPLATDVFGHALGILFIEIGVAMCVMATVLVIYSTLERSMEDES